jgi:hypothetical protein
MRIARGKQRLALVAVVATAALAVSGGVAFAVFPNDSVTHYTGCLNTNASPGGTFSNVAVGDTPAKACGSGQVLVHLSGGDITAVGTAAGSGLSGGKDNGAASLALDSTGCSSGGVLKWSGTSWSCGSDNNSTYSGSDFALSNQNCTSGQFDTGINANGNLTCAAPPTPPSTDAYIASHNDAVGIINGTGDNEVLSLSVPAGNYAVTAKTNGLDLDNDYFIACKLWAGSSVLDETFANAESGEAQSVSLVGTASFASSGTLRVTCFTHDDGVEAEGTKIGAVSVSNLH